MKADIEGKLQDLLIAESALSAITTFVRGEPLIVPTTSYPIAVVYITGRELADVETGQWVYTYTGYVAVEVLIPEAFTVVGRRTTLDSYDAVQQYVDAVEAVLLSHLNLDGLSGPGGEKVRVISPGRQDYGLNARQNNYLNRGELAFTVQTQKSR